jgi:TIR domain
MPVVPGFEYDLFVSYAHADNYAFSEGQPGWVADFIHTLRDLLLARSRDFTLWNDPRLLCGEDFNLAIADSISKSAVFISLLSPAYYDSQYCKKEVNSFRDRPHPSFGLRVGSISRMQAVVLENLPEDRWPPELRTTSPFRFFSDTVDRFSKPVHPDDNHPYVQGLFKTRNSIWAALDEMRRQKADGTAIEHTYDTGSDPTVYLAEVTDDLYPQFEKLRDTLTQSKSVQVIAPSDESLAAGPSVLSLHQFSKVAGRPVSGKPLSRPRLQLEAALACHPARRPLVWLPNGLDPADAESPDHRAFLESLRNNSGVEIVNLGLEDLKAEVLNRLLPRTSPVNRTVRRNREDPIVYIWHNVAGTAPLDPLKSVLRLRNCGVSVFPYATVPPEKLQSKLAFCDGLVVPYTAETKAAAEDMLTEAFQRCRREERPIAYAAVALHPPPAEPFNFEHPSVVPLEAAADGGIPGLDEFLGRL